MMKSIALTAVAAIMLLTSGTAAAEVVKVNVGPTLNPFFLRLVCNRVATERGGRLVNTERAGQNKNGVCYIDIPRRTANPGIVMTPGTVRQPVQNQPVRQQPIPAAQGPNLKMVNVGKLWSQPHAEQRCKRIARKQDATWTGLWKKHDSIGPAQCQLKVRPAFIIKPFVVGRIWNDSHAKFMCPRIAQKQGGTWTGKWQANPQDINKAICMVRIKNVRKVVKPFNTIKIWSDAHAKQHCTDLAQKNKGIWAGKWRNNDQGAGSICMIEVAHNQPNNQAATQNTQQQAQQQPAPTQQNPNVRNVKAGDIWDQKHAERKCPVVARNAKGSWTGKWTKTGPGNKSVCTVRFGGGIVAQATRPTATKPAAPANNPRQNTRTRNVAAGPIWDNKQAKTKCPVVAANNKARWTGKWTKTGPGHISVCEISVGVATPAAQSTPIQVRVKPSTLREVPAGGIWDQSHANRKCPVVAFNNKGRWTGKWRKINGKNDAVCEIDTSK